jgi:coenzyme F420-0:L-glutamate ligase/coenzyme F420-1:gamma-L-glutamate ligase
MTPRFVSIIPVTNLAEVKSGDEIGQLIAGSIRASLVDVESSDICVVAQKIVSKAEDRLVNLALVTPSQEAINFATDYDKDPRVVQVVLNESRRIVRMERGIIISETRHGFVCANAGVDTSNVEKGFVSLLPVDPDASARRIRHSLRKELGTDAAVIISDTFGRPWREGLVNVAIGVAGIAPLIDYRGQVDSHGNALRVTVISVADELASAAELVMGKHSGVPAAIVRGFKFDCRLSASSKEMIRPSELDLFR